MNSERKGPAVDFAALINKDFVILDGALGTELQRRGLKSGEPPEKMLFSDFGTVVDVHRSYVEAGADVIYTDTFGANRYKLDPSGPSVDEVVKRALDAARCAGAKTVALDVGPLGRLIEPLGDLSFEEAYEAFREVVVSGEKNGADMIVIETMSDLFEIKAALLAAKENTSLPVLCSMSFEAGGRTFTGCGAREAAITLSSLGADAIGVNCSTGPDDLFDTVAEILRYSTVPVSVKPNAGLPDPVTGKYSLKADEFARFMKKYAEAGVKFLGGCCGTTPEYIKKTIEASSDVKYKKPEAEKPLVICSAGSSVFCTEPRVIGERINPTGKKLLKEAIRKGDIDYILSLAAEQIDAGADILDINVGVPGIDEKKMMTEVVKAVQGVFDVPVQIDSSDPEAIEAALRVCRGRAIVNSVNGTEASLSTVLPIVKKYGAAVVGLTLDEDGIPDNAADRVKIAEKIVRRAEALGIPRSDIIIDCLTLTVSVDQTAALVTLDALKTVKRELGVKTVLGVSNVSFGLPEREVVSRTFFDMALDAGLDFAIIDPKLKNVSPSDKARKVLEGLDEGAAEYIASCVATEKKTDAAEKPAVTLAAAVERGMRAECATLTRDLLLTMDPLDVVNKKLIPILDDVGDRFEKGTLFLPQLIMAADTIGVCFNAVKAEMAKKASSVKGDRIILATVKGDIHDIGKSIVKVLLENYGYDVIDLGRDVDPEVILQAAIEREVRLVGLSALMTTTLGAMQDTIKLLKAEKPDTFVMVGGAVLTADYAASIGADFYAKDAKGAVDIAKRVFTK